MQNHSRTHGTQIGWGAILVLLMSPVAFCADAPVLPECLMVIRWDVEIGVDDDVGTTLNLGEIVEVTHRSPGFRWSPWLKAWVPADALIKTTKVEDHFRARLQAHADAEAYHDRGVARLALKDYQAAISDFDMALQMRASFAAALTNRGRTYAAIGQFDRAITDLDAAIEINRKDHVAYTFRGVARAGLGQLEAAILDLDRALAADPSYVAAWNNRGVVNRLLSRSDRAIDDFTKAIELDGSNAAAYSNRAFVRSQVGRYTESLADYEQAIRRAPTSREIRCDLAWLLSTCPADELRDGDRALRIMAEIERQDQQEVDVLDTRAAMLAELGRYSEAVKTMDSAIRRAAPRDKTELESRRSLYVAERPFRLRSGEPGSSVQ